MVSLELAKHVLPMFLDKLSTEVFVDYVAVHHFPSPIADTASRQELPLYGTKHTTI